MAGSGGHDPQLRKRQLHLRSGYGEEGTNVAVEELVMDDGVQYVALEKEAFDAAFGGDENILKAMPRETANYIEVSEPTTVCTIYVGVLGSNVLTFGSTREEYCQSGYTTLSRSCKRRS